MASKRVCTVSFGSMICTSLGNVSQGNYRSGYCRVIWSYLCKAKWTREPRVIWGWCNSINEKPDPHPFSGPGVPVPDGFATYARTKKLYWTRRPYKIIVQEKKARVKFFNMGLSLMAESWTPYWNLIWVAVMCQPVCFASICAYHEYIHRATGHKRGTIEVWRLVWLPVIHIFISQSIRDWPIRITT